MPVDSVELPPAFRTHLDERELRRNSTLRSFGKIKSQLSVLSRSSDQVDSILHIGCKWGGFSAALGEYLNAAEVYGVDTDDEMRDAAQKRGVKVFDTDVNTESIELQSDSVDLVVCFGLLEHLTYYDNLFAETSRVLRQGLFWITTPNLSSWLNRFAILTGHQPRNVEISRERAVGTLPGYRKTEFLDHIHAPTFAALIELFEYYGFDPIETATLTPYQHSRVVALLDRIFSMRTAWGRRVSVLAEQHSE